jgi:hypothetical protein
MVMMNAPVMWTGEGAHTLSVGTHFFSIWKGKERFFFSIRKGKESFILSGHSFFYWSNNLIHGLWQWV